MEITEIIIFSNKSEQAGAQTELFSLGRDLSAEVLGFIFVTESDGPQNCLFFNFLNPNETDPRCLCFGDTQPAHGRGCLIFIFLIKSKITPVVLLFGVFIFY